MIVHRIQSNRESRFMNIKAYYYIYKTRIQKSLAYRFDVYGNIIMQCIIMFASAFFWRALYVGQTVVQGVDVSSMFTYTIISTAMSVFFMGDIEYRVMRSVEKGTIAVDMLKPVNLYSIFFFEDLGKITALFFQNVIPILLIGCIFITIPKPAGVGAFFLFLLSLSMAFLINWLIAACFSMWAFTAINMDPLLQVKKHLIRLLSGSIIPMWFFPKWLSSVLNCLPFVYIYQLPLDIYIGKEAMSNILPRLGIQALWVVILFTVFMILQKNATRKVMVQGG